MKKTLLPAVLVAAMVVLPKVSYAQEDPSQPFIPPTKIDLKQLRDRLLNQASFRFEVEPLEYAPEGKRYDVITFKLPFTRWIRVYSKGAIMVHWVKMGSREWVGFGTSPQWFACTSISPALIRDGKDLCQKTEGLLNQYLANALPDTDGNLEEEALKINGTLCDQYELSGKEGKVKVYISRENGLPVRAEMETETPAVCTFDRINDTANIANLPCREDYPNMLHIDDALMALNGLKSFRWTETRVSSEDILSWHGTYVQERSSWHSSLFHVKDKNEGNPLIQLLHIEPNSWIKYGSTMWKTMLWNKYLSGRDERDLDSMKPFTFWLTLRGLFVNGNIVKKTGDPQLSEYLLQASWNNDKQDDYAGTMRLFVDPNTKMPMRAEVDIEYPSGQVLSGTYEISGMNDANNVIGRLRPEQILN